MEASMQDAYREACLALGEMVVRERLLLIEMAARQRQEAPDETPEQERP